MATQNNHSDSLKPSEIKSVPLARLQEDFDNIELPWPDDIFGGFDKWSELDEFLKTLGYRVDNVSAELMRRGWKVHRKQVQDQVITAAFERLEDEAEAIKNAPDGDERSSDD